MKMCIFLYTPAVALSPGRLDIGCACFHSPAVHGGVEPGGRHLPEDQLQPRELRQRPALLQESPRQHRVADDGQAGGLCAPGAPDPPAAGQGGETDSALLMSAVGLFLWVENGKFYVDVSSGQSLFVFFGHIHTMAEEKQRLFFIHLCFAKG